MFTYIVRRILWMIPTLFVISLIVFAIVNLAPGSPGDYSTEQGKESAQEGEGKREAQRMFKEQFNLNKPVLLNFRYRLQEEEILGYVATLARQRYLFRFEFEYRRLLGEGDAESQLRRLFATYGCELSNDVRIVQWLIADGENQTEFLVGRWGESLVVSPCRYPMELEEESAEARKEAEIVQHLVRALRIGTENKEIERYVRQNAPQYLDALGDGADRKSLFPRHVFCAASFANQISAGAVSEDFRRELLLHPRRYKLSNHASVDEWWIYDPLLKKEYMLVRDGEHWLVYLQRAEVPSSEMILAEETLENYGFYALPHLANIVRNTRNEEIRRVAVGKFGENARERRRFRRVHHLEGRIAWHLIDRFERDNPDLARNRNYDAKLLEFVNAKIAGHNERLGEFRYSRMDARGERLRKFELLAAWQREHAGWFEYTRLEKILITLSDTRFARYWWNLAHFDFGISHLDRMPVTEKVTSRLRYSISLSLLALLLAYFIAVPLGIFSAVKQRTIGDYVITVILFMLYSLPNFFVATLLLKTLGRGGDFWQIFPSAGFRDIDAYTALTTWGQLKDILWHLVLPVVCLTYTGLASLSRYGRAGVIDVIRSDYIKTARAKGLPEYIVILRHAVRNGMIPILTLLGSVLPVLLGGSIVIEVIFSIDGMGKLILTSIGARDYNTIMCISLFSAVLVMLGILLSDISYALLDPRIRFK